MASLAKDGIGVEVDHTAATAAEVARRTIDTVGTVVGEEAVAVGGVLGQPRRILLMGGQARLVVGEPLAEEEIVVRIDKEVVLLGGLVPANVRIGGYSAVGIDEVTVGIAAGYVVVAVGGAAG